MIFPMSEWNPGSTILYGAEAMSMTKEKEEDQNIGKKNSENYIGTGKNSSSTKLE